MDDKVKYVAGLDIGTSTVRMAIGGVDNNGMLTLLGVTDAINSGMRKGVVSNFEGPAIAIDSALRDAEKMTGVTIDKVVVNINGSHILFTNTDGVIAIGNSEHSVDSVDVERIASVAMSGKVPANREILELIPYNYTLDGQSGIKDPLGMKGSRLEIKAGVISALLPNVQGISKLLAMVNLNPTEMIVSGVAAAKAVLTEKQMENGVAVVDFGASTINIAIFEESDPKYVSVIPMGSNNITNDLAMELKIETELAEELKLKYVDVNKGEDFPDIAFSKGREHFVFPRGEVDEIVDARLDEIFSAIRNEFKKAGYDRRLPEGVVLVGDGSRLKNIKGLAKDKLEVSTRIGTAENIAGGGCVDKKPEYATSVGLMIIAAQAEAGKEAEVTKESGKDGKMEGFFKRLIGKFKD